MACGGHVTLFYEFVGPKQFVYIFGAGHCGAALAKLLRPLNFYVTIIDERKSVIDALDDSANVKVNKGFVEYIEENHIPDNRYIVVCTPSHQNDYNVLDAILRLNIKPKYFGMLCSKRKLETISKERLRNTAKMLICITSILQLDFKLEETPLKRWQSPSLEKSSQCSGEKKILTLT